MTSASDCDQGSSLALARDQRCRFRSRNRASSRSDIDHTTDGHHGGKTEPGNLACLCRRHHTLKQFGGWKVRQKSPGVLEWTSPAGRIITG
ncbi:HNH endonuclease signature motif containing protein [Salinibacterium sp. SWN167]|uniref:HNH endonuclease signature motif containing protein n=1 Tax=Salinibacterium sp. SWN167 TaxID=2792054 RepID=UPI0018CD5CCA|nr:HNH endonuclease [Salinibacterium sp. SWN167]